MASLFRATAATARSCAIASSSSSTSASSAAAHRLFTTSSSSHAASWGGGKIKTHQGTSKRFRAISKPRPRFDDNPSSITARLSSFAAQNGGGGSGTAGMTDVDYALAVEQMATTGRGEMRPGPLFKRGKTGKRHLNLQINGSRLNGLGGTAVAGRGRNGWHLRKLLAPIV